MTEGGVLAERGAEGVTTLPFTLAGEAVEADPAGALWWPGQRLLAVADLHLEKGSFFAGRGQFLPPHDGLATLAALASAVARHRPRHLLLLGDSFHDPDAGARMVPALRAAIAALAERVDLHWITGNHDPVLPEGLPGAQHAEVRLGALTFRHEPRPGRAAGEVAGHLHPVAKVAGSRGRVRRRAFATDGNRVILPAFGAYAGGLNLRDPAFALHFPRGCRALALGQARVFAVPEHRLARD